MPPQRDSGNYKILGGLAASQIQAVSVRPALLQPSTDLCGAPLWARGGGGI